MLPNDHVLVLRAPTLLMNPGFDPTVVAREEAVDPESARAEYHAEWRHAGAGLVASGVLNAVIDVGVTERAPERPLGDDFYAATCDLSGGTGADSATLSIQHLEETDGGVEHCVQDLLRAWAPPFQAPAVVAEIAAMCARYGITEVAGDAFAKGFVAPEFARHGVTYVDAPSDTSESYILALAALNSRRVRLLDIPVARRQWLSLQRHYGSGGRVRVDHPGGGHDDLADATAKGIVVALGLGIEEEAPHVVRFR